MSTFTTSKHLEKPANGADVNTWDVPLNGNSDAIDACFGGLTSLNATSVSGNVTLSSTQYRPPIVEITGTLTGNISYQLPANVGGFWAIFNNTSGAFSIQLASQTGAGSVLTLPQGYTTFAICDGTNVGLGTTTVGSAAGATNYVQYNASGVLAGSANFTWNGTTLRVLGTLAIAGASSGAVGFAVPAAAGSVTYTLPATAGSAGQFLTSDGEGNLSWTGAVGGVTSFSAGGTGFTPSGATGGAIVLGGTLGTGYGGTGLTAFTSGKAVYATSTSALTTGTLPTSAGGTGVAVTPTAGQVLIGTGSGYSANTLTAGSGIAVVNGSGTVTISATNSGSVTSVGLLPGSTGLTVSNSPITSAGNMTLGGTVAVAAGGTGAGTASGARTNLGVPTGTSGAVLGFLNTANTVSAVETHTAGVQTTPAAVAFSATAMTLDASQSNVFATTFTANVTSAPTVSNPGDGQTVNWFITQDGTGSRTMTWPTSFKWPGGSAGILSTGAGAVDLLVATYRAATGFWYATLTSNFS